MNFVTIFWLICRDRNSALCHIRVSLTSCIGAGHIIFYAGIDSTGNQVTLWTPTFVLLSWCCCSCDLLVYLFVCFLIDLASYWFNTDCSKGNFGQNVLENDFFCTNGWWVWKSNIETFKCVNFKKLDMFSSAAIGCMLYFQFRLFLTELFENSCRFVQFGTDKCS